MKVAELWRFPVKSMQGERLESLDIGPAGAEGDRRWAVVSRSSGTILTAKTVPELLSASARIVDGELVVEHPGLTGAVTDRSLSAWLGRDVVLAEASRDVPASYEMTFDPPNDAAEVYEIPTPSGTFMDLASVHLLSTASLARAREARPDLQWDRRRFRPTVLVDCDESGFPEQHWVGGPLRVGGAVLSVDLETVRCAMPLRAQPALGHEPALGREVDVYRTLDAIHYNHLGVYCSVAEPGRVSVGDAVARSGAAD